tara:strand:- start:180 stop:353 length:174 start_codon:yes stop_codon:yes gene_type:complete
VKVRIRVRARVRVTLEQHVAAVRLITIVDDPIAGVVAFLQLEERGELVELHLRARLG